MSKIIAICNQKGGVAKTTTTYNIATLSAMKGYKTLMIDLDSQGSLTISTGAEPLDFEINIATLFEEMINKKSKNMDVRSAIYPVEGIENLYLIPSIIDLATKEALLNTVTAKELTLKRILEKVVDDYDYIFIDCSPSLGNLTINALSASDYLIIPTEADYLSYRGLGDLLSVVDDIKELINSKLEFLGVIITKYESRLKDANEVLEHLQSKYDVLGIVKKSVSIKDGIYAGLPLVVSPKNEIAKEIKEEYEKVFNYIENY
ncbi:ParA family protein [Tissierella pigra]|uniref:ParA family protein n=1 Tax=Tissierella pigra TaxID=2607614 RepID=UPI001C11499D|nr:ParA family protein [Tissierella pigra]MBU5428416.1 ParA family protein [Tissierella pigra]